MHRSANIGFSYCWSTPCVEFLVVIWCVLWWQGPPHRLCNNLTLVCGLWNEDDEDLHQMLSFAAWSLLWCIPYQARVTAVWLRTSMIFGQVYSVCVSSIYQSNFLHICFLNVNFFYFSACTKVLTFCSMIRLQSCHVIILQQKIWSIFSQKFILSICSRTM